MVKYNFEGKSYEITITDEWDMNEQREEQILIDFKYLESKKEWLTIKNRILNGTTLGWMVCVGDIERIELPKNEKGFW